MKYKLFIAGGMMLMVGSNASYATDYNVTSDIVNQSQILDPRAGAFYLVAGDTLVSSDGVSFTNNNAPVIAGAIENFQGTVTIGKDNKFIGNTITSPNDTNAPGQPRNGAAIANWGVLNIGDNVLFQNNITTNRITNTSAAVMGFGGAIYNKKSGASVGEIRIGNNAKFIGNKVLGYSGSSYSNGGAIYNYMGDIDIGVNSLFADNQVIGNGGAINNEGGTMYVGAGAVFKNNTALPNQQLLGPDYYSIGGAINNWAGGIINFLGDVTFANNMADGKPNDIANGAVITFADGSNVVLTGGITNTGTGSLILFGDDTSLTFKLSAVPTISSDKITIGSNAVIKNLVIGTGAVGDGIALTDGVLTGDFVLDPNYTNALYNVSYLGGGLFNINQKSTEEITSSNAAITKQEVAIARAVTANGSNNATFNAIQENINTMLQTGGDQTTQAFVALMNLAPATAPIAHVTATQNATQIFNVAGTRFNSGTPIPMGMSSGDVDMGDFTLWGSGIANYAKLHTHNGFDAKSGGFAVGVEWENDNIIFGAGYAYTSTDVDADDRDIDIKSNTALAYAQYKPSEWYGNLIASYTWGKNDEDKNVLGVGINSENHVNSLALQGMVGYDLFVPQSWLVDSVKFEGGLRYINVDTDDYTDSAGTHIDGNNNDIFTGVARLHFDTTRGVNEWLKLHPRFSVALTYDIARDDASSVVTLANGSVFSVVGDNMNRFGSEFELGLGFLVYDRWDVSVNYMGKFRSHYEDHSGILNVRYTF